MLMENTSLFRAFLWKKERTFGIMVKKKEKDEEMQHLCAFCEFATPLPTADGEDDDMICEKRGVVRADFSCKKFRYDLLKRDPKEKPGLGSFCVVSLDD